MSVIATLTMNPTIDVSTSIDFVVAERKLRCGDPSYDPGGGGLNVSRAIRKLGGDSAALYVSGGPTGQLLHDLLAAEGINQKPIPIKEWVRENFIVLETSTDRQYRFGLPGPGLEEKEWKACLDALSSLDPRPDYIVVSGSLPPGVPTDFAARASSVAKDLGARLVVDTSGEALQEAAKGGAFMLKPNLRELGQITGQEFQTEPQQRDLAMDMVKSGRCELIIVSLGAGGALVASKDGCERLHAPTVPIKSKVGAGDSMVAGAVLALSRGMSFSEAARFGMAAGTAAVMTPATQLCRREDVERLFPLIKSEIVR